MIRRLRARLPLALFTLLVVVLTGSGRGRVRADADWLSVRTGGVRDWSTRAGDPEGKYFHEATFDKHYDGRFASKALEYEERKGHLAVMIQAYLSTMADLGAETWLMHGTLMGWWWNRKILPWDSDVDVQMTFETLSYLAGYYNMSVFHYRLPNVEEGRDYMIEINPAFKEQGMGDELNMIDARWIDMGSGLYIDVTTVRVDEKARKEGVVGALGCKDRHSYVESDLFPLRDSVFEATRVKIPFDYAWLLEEEYGMESLTRTEYERHKWNRTSMLWEPLPSYFVPAKKPPSGKRPWQGRPGARRPQPGRPQRPSK